MANDPQIQFLINPGAAIPGTIPSAFISLQSPFTKDSTTGKITLQVKSGQTYNVLDFIRFNDAAEDFFDAAKDLKITDLKKRKEDFAKTFMKFEVVSLATTSGAPPATISDTGQLIVNGAGNFVLSVYFDPAAVTAYNKLAKETYDKRIANIGLGTTDYTQQPGERLLDPAPTVVLSTSDPLSEWEQFGNSVLDGLNNLGKGAANSISSVTQYLTQIALGATEEFNEFLNFLRDKARDISPEFFDLLENEIKLVENAIEENKKNSVFRGFLKIPLDKIPGIGKGLALVENFLVAAVTIGSKLTGAVYNLGRNVVQKAISKVEDFLQIEFDDKLLGIVTSILGVNPNTVKKVLQVVKDLQRIEELLASGRLGEAAEAIKEALLDNHKELGFNTREEAETKIDSFVNAGITFFTGNIVEFLFPSKKGLSVKRDLKMSTNNVGILTITNPKESGNNLQVTQIIFDNAKIDETDIIIDSIEIVTGGNFSVMNSETDVDDAIDFEAEVPIVVSPGENAQIKINFRNPDNLEGILSIDTEFTYVGLKPSEKITADGKKIIEQIIDEGDDIEEKYTNSTNTPGSNKVPTQRPTNTTDEVKSIQDKYAKIVEEFSKSQKLLTDKTAALEQAKKVGGQALIDASKDLQDAQKELEEIRKKLNETKEKLDKTLSAVQAAQKAIDDFKKKNYMDALNKVNFESLPPEFGQLLLEQGAQIGVTEDDVKKYYETINEGAKKITRARDLLGKNNPVWGNLKKYQQASLAERLRLTWNLLNDTIDIHNGLQGIFGDPRENIERVADPVTQLEKLTDQYKEKILRQVVDGIKLPNGLLLTCANMDEATREAIGIALGIYPDLNIKNDKKRLDDWKNRICDFFKVAEKVKEIQRKRENLRNEIVKRTNAERAKAKTRKENKTENKVPIKNGNKTKNEEKKINRPDRGKPITGVGDKIYRIDPINTFDSTSPGVTSPIQVRELSKEVTIIPVPEMAFYEDDFRTHYESLGITPDTIQDIYDNAEEIIKDPIMDLKDAIEAGNTGAVKGFISPETLDNSEEGTGGTGGVVLPPPSGTGGAAVPEGVTGQKEFEEGEEGKDYGTYIIYADETKTKFSVEGQTLDTPFLYGIYRYVLCSNDTPETSKARAKANILKFKDELSKKYFIQGSDEYVGDDSCPNDEIQIRLVPSTGPSGDIILKREASERKIRTGIIEAENTYIDQNGKIREAPSSTNDTNAGFKWRDKYGIQQPLPFIYPEDEQNVVTYDPSLFDTKDPQNDNQKSVRERIIYLLQTGGISASRIAFDILADGSVVWDGEVKINKRGLTGDGKIPLTFAVVNGKFDCSGLDLTTLENSPKLVYGEFNCSNNKLTTLEKGPTGVVAFVGDNNPLGDGTGLKYGPQLVIGWPIGTILNGPNGYIYSCENCKLENFNDNGLTVFGQGGINFSKNKLKSFDEISDAFGNGVTSIDISNNEFQDAFTFPPIIPALAFNENWLDYESKAFYRNPLNRGVGQADYGKNKIEKTTTQTINNFIIEWNSQTKNLVKPNSGTSADMTIREYIKGAYLPKSDVDDNAVQKPRATLGEIKQILSKIKEGNSNINYPVIVAIRNYFSGLPDERNHYRDAIFLVVNENQMFSYNANTVPTKQGINKEIGKGFAVLQPGSYIYTLGLHNGTSKIKNFPALVQPSVMNKDPKSEHTVVRKLITNAWKASLNDTGVQSDASKLLKYIFPTVDQSSPIEAVQQISKNIKNIFGQVFNYAVPVVVAAQPSPAIKALFLLFGQSYGNSLLNNIIQASNFELPTVPFIFKRDGDNNLFIDSFGVVQTNLHPGSYFNTWSFGCQTIPYAEDVIDGQPKNIKYNQWNDFYTRAKDAIQKRNEKLSKSSNLYNSIEYILLENPFKQQVKKETPVPGKVNNQSLKTTFPKGIIDLPTFKF